ncbi:MAG: hypothetical protein AAF074_14920 [Pseudomonadota bacterium]
MLRDIFDSFSRPFFAFVPAAALFGALALALTAGPAAAEELRPVPLEPASVDANAVAAELQAAVPETLGAPAMGRLVWPVLPALRPETLSAVFFDGAPARPLPAVETVEGNAG